MTRKDYELIANVIKGMNKPHNDSETVAEIAYQFALTLAGTNDRFNREMFLKACGVN